MKTTKITYWITTLLLVGMMTMSAIMQLIQAAPTVEATKKIGLPLQLTFLLGILKIFGIIALIVPGYPKIREWAYAGFTFLLIGATYLHFSIGDYQPTTLVLLVIVITSYFTNRKRNTTQEKKLKMA